MITILNFKICGGGDILGSAFPLYETLLTITTSITAIIIITTFYHHSVSLSMQHTAGFIFCHVTQSRHVYSFSSKVCHCLLLVVKLLCEQVNPYIIRMMCDLKGNKLCVQ